MFLTFQSYPKKLFSSFVTKKYSLTNLIQIQEVDNQMGKEICRKTIRGGAAKTL